MADYQEFLDGLDRAAYHEGELTWEEDGFTVTRTYRGAVYEIAVDNAAGVEKGVKCITADGAPCVDGILPAAPAGTTVHVKVTMG